MFLFKIFKGKKKKKKEFKNQTDVNQDFAGNMAIS